MPRYMDSSFEYHENPPLASIFDAVIPAIAKILVEFNNNHPVVHHFNGYFNLIKKDTAGKKKHSPTRDIP